MNELHRDIMNLPCEAPEALNLSPSERSAYLLGHRDARHAAAGLVSAASSAAPADEPSGETMAQREEVCAAWFDLPDQLTAHPAMKRLYRALGGINRENAAAAPQSLDAATDAAKGEA